MFVGIVGIGVSPVCKLGFLRLGFLNVCGNCWKFVSLICELGFFWVSPTGQYERMQSKISVSEVEQKKKSRVFWVLYAALLSVLGCSFQFFGSCLSNSIL